MSDHRPDDAVRTATSEAAWATIQLVNELNGTTVESYERLLEYGEMVDLGVRPPAAADLVLRILDRGAADEAAEISADPP